jgi:succinate dehydrogenase / fumarate reductase membrane anchor subunit
MLPTTPKPREGAWLWLYKIVAGLLIVFVLSLHFVVNHLVAEGGLLTYNDVVRYYASPLIVAIEIAFLLLAVSHSLVGLRSILLDLNPSEKVLRWADRGFLALGAVAIVYGVILALIVAGRAG